MCGILRHILLTNQPSLMSRADPIHGVSDQQGVLVLGVSEQRFNDIQPGDGVGLF